MAPALMSTEEMISDEVSGLDTTLSALAYYSHSLLPILVENVAAAAAAGTNNWLLPLSDEARNCKKLKRTQSVDESIGSNSKSNSSLYSGGDGDGDGSSNNSSRSSNGMISRCGSTNSLNSLPKLHFRDHIWTYTQRYLAAGAVEEAVAAAAEAAMSSSGSSTTTTTTAEGGEVEEDGSRDGMRLVQLLIACAEAVACRDKTHASTLLAELRADALVLGSSFQRVASCFVQGLEDRLSLVQPLGAVGYNNIIAPPSSSSWEKREEALRLVYDICPFIKFGHFVANASILEAFEGENFVHVVDLGMSLGLAQGQQWCQLIHSLANRSGCRPPRRIRITGVGLSVDRYKIIGEELQAYAHKLDINLEFSAVESNLENLQPHDIKREDGEALVVNSILQLHCVVKESRGALNSVLRIIHQLSPKVLVLVEQDSSHNGPFFLGRFMEALHYYSAIFDSLEAMLPKYDTRRAKIEQFYFGEEIKNIVSCEGPGRVERHERVDQWRRRMSRAGFQAAPVKMMAQAKQWLGKVKACEGYTIMEEKGCLVLGWKSKPIVAASCWKC